MHPMLNTAIKAARRAGAIINRASNDLDKLTVRSKQQNDFVSEVDHAAENAIIGVLREAYPQHAILAEESGASDGTGAGADHVWVIDPLDGTTNFLHGLQQYCVSIALLHKGVLTHGVIYDPNRNELFTASRGAGAFLNDRRIRAAKTLNLKDALVGTGFPFREVGNLDRYMANLRAVMLNCAGVRRPGAAALDLAYVACGRYDAFWEMGLAKWDMAAGALMIQEAGGLVSDLDGEEHFMDKGQIIAGTPKVFRQLLALLSPQVKLPA